LRGIGPHILQVGLWSPLPSWHGWPRACLIFMHSEEIPEHGEKIGHLVAQRCDLARVFLAIPADPGHRSCRKDIVLDQVALLHPGAGQQVAGLAEVRRQVLGVMELSGKILDDRIQVLGLGLSGSPSLALWLRAYIGL